MDRAYVYISNEDGMSWHSSNFIVHGYCELGSAVIQNSPPRDFINMENYCQNGAIILSESFFKCNNKLCIFWSFFLIFHGNLIFWFPFSVKQSIITMMSFYVQRRLCMAWKGQTHIKGGYMHENNDEYTSGQYLYR